MELVIGERSNKPYGPGTHLVPMAYLYEDSKKREVPENKNAVPPKLTYQKDIKRWRLDFYGLTPNGKGLMLFSYYFDFETEVMSFLKGKQ